MSRLPDWTEGAPALVYQACSGCRRRWYFRREFCPACGSVAVSDHAATGHGTVHAVTEVSRAPSPEWKAHAPYTLLLVDMTEGFRVMAHGSPGLAIGDPVEVSFRELAGRLIPFFNKPGPLP